MKKIFLVRDQSDLEILTSNGFAATLKITDELLKQYKQWPVVVPIHADDAGMEFWQAHKGGKYTKKDEVFVVPSLVNGQLTVTYLDLFKAGMTRKEFINLILGKKEKQKSNKAVRKDYFELIERVLKNPKKCIFNQKLMHFEPDTALWNPSINCLEIIKSEALFENESRDAKFNKSDIQSHFFAYELAREYEFLIDIPEWDGTDRISAMAYLVKLRDRAGITEESFSELLKEWCGLMFQRLHDPMIQNKILVLQGGQGIGKDTWTSMLVDGLGQFCIPLSIVSEDKDTYLSLHRGLVMKIAEFDKTAKTEVSTLKDIITSPSTDLRAPYDKDARVRLNRCSFISSANAEYLLRDSTGNRRFLIFEIESIEYAYEGWDKQKIKDWQMQCLAQMVQLANDKYKASAEASRQMREYIERNTPSELAEDVIDNFYHECTQDLILSTSAIAKEVPVVDNTITSIINKLSKNMGLKTRTIKGILQQKIGTRKRIGDKRPWCLKIPATVHSEGQEGAGQARPSGDNQEEPGPAPESEGFPF